jgi:hypothetical protein
MSEKRIQPGPRTEDLTRPAVMVMCFSLALSGLSSVRAAGNPAEELLKKHGLKLVGSLYVLELESDVQTKMNELNRQAAKLKLARVKQSATPTAKDREQAIKNLNDEISEYRTQINMANQQISQTPFMGNRRGFGGGYGNNYTTAAYQQLVAYRNQLQASVNQGQALLNQLKNEKYDPAAREKADAEVRDLRDSYHEGLLDVRKQVDAAIEKYAELAKDEQVKKALDSVAKRAQLSLKLGPSPRFQSEVKLLERLEKASADAEAEPEKSASKAARPSRKSVRSKRSSRAATNIDN